MSERVSQKIWEVQICRERVISSCDLKLAKLSAVHEETDIPNSSWAQLRND